MMSMTAVLTATLLGGTALAQDMPPNAPHFVKSQKARGVDVRYLDFKWDPEAFAAIEKGGTQPAGRRSWALARILLLENPVKWEGRTIPVGPSLLILNPGQGGAGPTFELRKVDMRDVFQNMNVIAEPPPGETSKTVPAVFRKAASTADRLDITLSERSDALDLTVHYGDRESTITLLR
jgi:hypothetical protein